MANKRYDQFPAGAYNTAKIFLQADAATGALEKINLPAIPVVTPYTGTANRITVTAFAIDIAATYVGQNSITTLGTIGTGIWNGTKISEAFGGTNQSAYATGDILYASAANTLSKLAIGGAGTILSVAGGVPVWSIPTTLLGYLKQDGSLPLTANWETGAFITSTTFTATAANTVFDGFQLHNTTVASPGNQMDSPAINFKGQGWKTTAVAGSQAVEFKLYNAPVQGSTQPSGNFTIASAINGGAFASRYTFNDTGGFTCASISTNAPSTFGNSVLISGANLAVSGGTSSVSRNGAGATSYDGIFALNPAPSTAGTPIQYSPRLRVTGTAWSGAANQLADWIMECQPVNGTNPVTSNFIIASQANALGYTTRLTIKDTGRVITTAPVTLKGYTVAGLPAGNVGDIAYVTNALAPAYGAALVGGGAVIIQAFFDGANWIAS